MEASPPAPVKVVNNYQNAQEGIWPNGPVQLARGRQAKDPNAKTVTYNVSSIEEFETSLREYLHNPPEQPEHTECQLSFYTNASFLVSLPSLLPPPSSYQSAQQHSHALAQLALAQHQRQLHPDHAHHQHQHPHPHPHPHPSLPPPPQAPPGYQPATAIHYAANTSHSYQSVSDPAIALTLPTYAPPSSPSGSSPSTNDKDTANLRRMTILEALANTADPKDKMKKQRAIAKCCIDSIQRTDGYRYSFHNCWNSREDDSFRFSYYCNDSLLNKDRAANGKGAKFGKRATKPVYDCKGVLAVKFSASKQSLDVFYKHVPVHKTYEERAPPPRKDSKRRKFLEENDPEALVRIANRPKISKPPESGDGEAQPKPKKKKAKPDDEPKTAAANSIESDLRAQSLRSLLELIQTDPDQESRPQVQTSNPRVEEAPAQQPQPLPQQQRRRARNSCDVCKTKKTKCDGARPICQTCFDKKRQCFYSEPYGGEDRLQSMPEPKRPSMSEPQQPNEPKFQVQTATDELSELERMKKELEEAKAKIQELQAEKTRSSTTPLSQTSQPPLRTQSQSQATPLQSQPKPQSQAQPQIRNAAQNSTPQSQQIRNAAQPQPQIRNAGQMPPQYGGHYNASHAPYTTNRPMPSQNGHSSQGQGSQQMHGTPSTDLTPSQDPTNPYSGRDFAWPTYYGYQNAPQNPQDQWAAAASRNFR